MNRRLLLACLLIGGLAQLAIAVDPLSNWLEARQARLSYDPLLQTYEIQRGSNTLRFFANSSWAILNNVDKVSFPGPSQGPSGLLADDKTLAALATLLDPPSNTDALRKINTIFIDPGHGGKDPGASGKFTLNKKTTTLQEKDITLSASLALRDLLRAQYPDKRIIMARETDVYMPLEDRTKLANTYAKSLDQSVLFISVHVNASLTPAAKGYEVWYLPPEYRRQIVKATDIKATDSSVLPLINDIVQESLTHASITLGQSILRGLDAQIGTQSPSRGLKEEEWYVVRNAFMPSVLVELGFVTNPDEFALMGSNAYLQKVATGIYSGVVSFVKDYESSR